jgi:hypothetical protein
VLVKQRKVEQADRELRLALAATGPDWVRGRAQTELGKIADLSGDRAKALEAYRSAVRLGRSGHDDIGVDEANRLIKKAYTGETKP